LYLLTVADVRATNPKLWNTWKAQLFEETYEMTKRALRQGLETPIDKEELLREKQAKALSLLQASEEDSRKAQRLWSRLGDEYLLRCKPEEIAWHATRLADQTDTPDYSLVDVQANSTGAGTTVFIYAPQAQFTFAIATAVLDEYGMSIADARIIPLENDQSLSIYTILEQDGTPIDEVSRRERIRRRLAKAISDDESTPKSMSRKVPRQARMFNTPTEVHFSDDSANNRTVMELIAGDRPGLLAIIGNALKKQNVYIRMAKIVTVGERAEDVFYITDSDRQMLSAEKQVALRNTLVSAIDESQ